MTAYIVRRLLMLVPIGAGVIILVALMAHAVPGDPIDQLLGQYATQEEKQELREKLGLNLPIGEQLLGYFNKLLHGDLGDSLLSQRSVSSLIAERFRPTAELALASIIVALLISIPLGILGALFAGKAIDYMAMMFALLGVSMPNFWLGSMLILLFSLELDLLPVSERTDWTSYILPAITMGTALAAVLSRMMRNSMLDVMQEDYVRTARAKGLAESLVIGKHVIRNAALPLVTVVGLQFGVILTGAVITEVIFDWPGLGTLLLDAVRSRDYPVIQGCVLMFSATYLIVNLLTDITYAIVDPRIKISD